MFAEEIGQEPNADGANVCRTARLQPKSHGPSERKIIIWRAGERRARKPLSGGNSRAHTVNHITGSSSFWVTEGFARTA